MNPRMPWAFGLLAVLAAALSIGQVATSPRAPDSAAAAAAATPAPTPTPSAEACVPACEPSRLLAGFFGLSAAQAGADPLAAVVREAKQDHYDLDFLIALVPDPIDSHLAYRYDEALDALQRAFADAGYLLDRVALPWQGEAAKAKAYRRSPGVLLFRAAAGHRLMTVLLVGESPKGGIAKGAFRTALDRIAAVHRETGLDSPVKLLGPTFSGSAESLRLACAEWREDGAWPAVPGLRIVTGSATASRLKGSFAACGPATTFERTVILDERLLIESFNFLEHRLGWDLGRVALLTEFDTAYGSSFAGVPGLARPLVVKFPSHLAHIRTAREKLGLDKTDATPQPAVDTGHKNLDPTLEEDKPVDVVAQSSELSTAAGDLALTNLLQTLIREQVRYVGIVATDLQDRLFLAEQIRGLCPDAVVFTFDNHLLDAHPRFAKAMNGTLVLSSYPLYIPHGQKGEQTRQQFTSELEEGSYRATLRLLGAPPAGTRTPGVWISAVGNGSLWPLAVLSQGTAVSSLRDNLRRSAIAGSQDTTFKWLIAAAVIAFLAAWLWTVVRPLQAAGELPQREVSWGHDTRLVPILAAGILWLASGVLLVFYSLPLLDPQRILSRQGGLWDLTLVLLGVLYLTVVWELLRLSRPPSRRLAGWRGLLVWAFVGAAMLALLRLAMITLWVLPEMAEFFYARASDFSSGLSPLVSLAFLGAAVFAWSLNELKRRRLIVLQRTPWPLGAAPSPLLVDCMARSGEIEGLLRERLPRRYTFWLGLAAALALPLPRLFKAIQPIAEPRAYGWAFLLLVALVFTLSALAFYRFYAVWSALEKILERLGHTWLLPAFAASAKLFDWRPMKSFGWRMPSFKMSLLAVEQLRGVARLVTLGPDGGALADDALLDALAADLDEALAAERRGDFVGEAKARRDLRQRLDESAAALQRRWREAGGAEPRPPDGPDGKPVPRPHEVELREIETYLAMRVVAYLRYVFAHLRSTLLSAMTCSLFLLLAVSSYAFQPKRFLSLGIWLALLLGSALTLLVFLRMDRNSTLSAIGDTTAGKATFDRTFFSNLLTYGGIPVLSVVFTQFPAVATLFGDWLAPLLRLLGAK